ncbi:hypothetical protein FA15DRAFT_670781 [Coprinopsis marcescibilis]|uniref:Nab2 type CCCH zinc finger 4 domain-containing protein n=1 Tax=Coprinopsis marcescibilis TaxID=230819 RepID=A0A5C3KRQ7_COPMA|nr:hypothetical protein FA15DRAFT_670781 [Coprinopsis marcescibilis]
MPFELTIGTERAAVFQQAIQDELVNRGYSTEPDSVMAEYITIMVINNKTAAQITTELEDLISSDIDSSFISWLFEEAAKGASGPEVAPAPVAEPEVDSNAGPSKEVPPHSGESSSRRQPARNGVYQQTISQVLPSPSNSAQKRSASARSPSPSHPNKSRRMDLPTGPRAMQKDGSSAPKSLLDRMGPNRTNGNPRDEVQRRIDSVTAGAPDPGMMIPPGFPALPPGMDMNMAANMVNPLMLQDMMMSQMAMMAQMATMLNQNGGQYNQPGFPMQNGMPGDMGMMHNNGFPGQGPPGGINNRGRGTGRGRGGPGRGQGNAPMQPINHIQDRPDAPVIVAPTPVSPTPPTSSPVTTEVVTATGTYALPERPQSPTLCKFGTKCTNSQCRYSHPSPVATAESGIVLSNEPCEKGKDCQDKDCTQAHVSPAVLNPNAESTIPNPTAPSPRPAPTPGVPCRFGLACTRPGCSFTHPPRQPCRFGTACTRSNCTFQHPPGRVLPSTFHRGLSTSGGMAKISTPETGSMAGSSHHRSVTFNNTASSTKEKLEKQMKEIEEKKLEMEKAMKDAAANGKKNADTNQVALAA